MNDNRQAFPGPDGAACENAPMADSARDATVIASLTHLGLLECTGADAKTFLHNQLTSDVNHLEDTAAQHSAWCSPKGRMLASFLLYRQGDGYRALLSADLLADTLKRLQIYVLRSKVKLADLSGGHELIGIAGPQAAAALGEAGLTPPQKPLETARFPDVTVIRLDGQRFIVAAETACAAACREALIRSPVGPVPVAATVWQWLDIQAGLPLICAATREEFVPQMVDFDTIGGVSFRKGCYPGQEIIARTRYLGRVKRHLYRLHADVGPIPAGSLLTASGSDEAVGRIVSAAPSPLGGYDALAVIREECFEKGECHLEVSGIRMALLALPADC